jgi:uncharacterized membrane protein HdeD (DUF308 family)
MDNMNDKKLSTMKIWGVISYGFAIILSILTILGIFLTDKDMTAMATLTGAWFVEVGVFTGAYAFKEKSANKMKMALGFIKELSDKYPIEDLAPIIQSVIQD